MKTDPTEVDLITVARALLAAATPGPWEADAWYGNDDGGWAATGPHHMATEDEGYDDAPESNAYDRAMADAALIAAAPELLAALCDALVAAEAKVARLEVRKAERCSRRILWDDGCCPKWCLACGGSGAVIVEDEE